MPETTLQVFSNENIRNKQKQRTSCEKGENPQELKKLSSVPQNQKITKEVTFKTRKN